MLAPPEDAEFDMINSIIYASYSVTAVPATMLACIIVGLPIRLISKLYTFWMKYPFIAFLGIVAGVCILKLAYQPAFGTQKSILIENTETVMNFKDEDLFYAGWFTLSFFLLHFYPIAFLNFVIDKFRKGKNIDWQD